MINISPLVFLGGMLLLYSCAPKIASIETPLYKGAEKRENQTSLSFQNLPKGLIVAESQEQLIKKVEQYAE